MSLPTDSQARKDIPIYSGLLAYFPDALAAIAAHSKRSNDKHNPGEPLHWSREKSNDHLDCIARHLTDIAGGADRIEELEAIAWRSMAQLQLDIEARQQAIKTKAETRLAFGPLDTITRAIDDHIIEQLVGPQGRDLEKHNIGEQGACNCVDCISRWATSR